MLELMVTVAVVLIISSIVIRSTYAYLQEQKLRQAANEFVSYLLTARSRALREGSLSGESCEVALVVPSKSPKTVVIEPTQIPLNVCTDSPILDLRAVSGIGDLTIESFDDVSYPITFTKLGTVASSRLSSSGTAQASVLTLPRIFYFSNSATQVRRCVMVDLNSFRIGWRNSKPTTSADSLCKYDGN